MFKFSRKIEYALMVLQYMYVREEQHLFSSREICDDLKISFDTTSKVLQTLTHTKVLKSTQGIQGGYCFDLNLSQFKLYDFITSIENSSSSIACESGDCELMNHCNIQKPLKKIHNLVSNYLKTISVKEVLDNKNGN